MHLNRDAAAQRREDTALSAQLHRLDPDRLPAGVAFAGALPVTVEDEFEFGLRLTIADLEAAPTGEARDRPYNVPAVSLTASHIMDTV